MMPVLRLGVALKWVDLRPEVDPLSGSVHDDGHSAGCSEADRAALEWALTLAERWSAELVVATVGPVEADALLRDAVAAGATGAVRVDGVGTEPSEQVAAALADVFAGTDLVCCGDYSSDRGSGSVPAYLAAYLGVAQALGLVHLVPAAAVGALTVTRRLDGGRREVLSVSVPAVVSVEGSSAQLRRASLSAVLAARGALIERRPAPVVSPSPSRSTVRVTAVAPYRPRAQVLPAPSPDLDVRDRILALTGALVERTPPRTVHADAAEAADLVLEQLRAWGELE
jgi:electron transfer flavoprotein beta subunit